MNEMMIVLIRLAQVIKTAEGQAGEWRFWFEIYPEHLMIKGMHMTKKTVTGFNIPYNPYLGEDTHSRLIVYTTAFMEKCKRGDF
jgi:hypothetical protein